MTAEATITRAPDAPRRITSPISDPRRREFLPQTPREQWLGLWWRVARKLVFAPSPLTCNAVRVWVLRRFGASVGRGASVHRTARIEYPWHLTLGEGATIRQGVLIECMGPIEIGDGAHVSQFSHLVSGTHDYRRPDMRIECRAIRVGAGAWIAADAFIAPGVTIGEGAIVGARSGVFSDIPPRTIAIGSRARPVRELGPGEHPARLLPGERVLG